MEAQYNVKSEPSQQQIPFWPLDDTRPSMQPMSPLTFSPTSPASSSTSASSIRSNYSGSVTPPFDQANYTNGTQMSDEELAQLTVRELNQRLQGQDRKMVSALKQKRRTLKNRGYAFNCRVRRLQLQLQLEAENVMLKNEMRYLRQMLQETQTRLSYYEGQPAVAQPPQFHQQQQQQQPQQVVEQPKYDCYNTVYPQNGHQQYYAPCSPPDAENHSLV